MSRLVLNRNGGSADEYGHLLALNRLLVGDVIEGMTVTQDTGSNMAVRVKAGSARIASGTSPSNYGYFVAVDTSGSGEQVTITTANSSNPRNDLIVAYVDLGVTPSTSTANNPNNMLKLAAVAGTPAASPADPTTAQIQSAIGASNPYIVLSRVRVAAAATSITTANCTDLRRMAGAVSAVADKFSAFCSTTPTAAASSDTKIVCDSENHDASGVHDSSLGRYVAATPGCRSFNAAVTATVAPGDLYYAVLYKNGLEWRRGTGIIPNGTAPQTFPVAALDELLAAGDYVELVFHNGSAGGKGISAGAALTYFSGGVTSAS